MGRHDPDLILIDDDGIWFLPDNTPLDQAIQLSDQDDWLPALGQSTRQLFILLNLASESISEIPPMASEHDWQQTWSMGDRTLHFHCREAGMRDWLAQTLKPLSRPWRVVSAAMLAAHALLPHLQTPTLLALPLGRRTRMLLCEHGAILHSTDHGEQLGNDDWIRPQLQEYRILRLAAPLTLMISTEANGEGVGQHAERAGLDICLIDIPPDISLLSVLCRQGGLHCPVLMRAPDILSSHGYASPAWQRRFIALSLAALGLSGVLHGYSQSTRHYLATRPAPLPHVTESSHSGSQSATWSALIADADEHQTRPDRDLHALAARLMPPPDIRIDQIRWQSNGGNVRSTLTYHGPDASARIWIDQLQRTPGLIIHQDTHTLDVTHPLP
ncbi:hypothetical protein KSF73_02245 [Burkholderiaceae bacterium DAT-1]|nr:hypothetical protein [Burkholderiaceae bacterium DAT-1]